MPYVASVDYVARRIYLHADTVLLGCDTMEVYTEVRALRRTTPAHRCFSPMILGQGNVSKGGGKYTARYVLLIGGCKIIPYDESHTLDVLVEPITDEGTSGAACFDRSTLSPGVAVDLNLAWDQVEIIEVNTGSGVTPSDVVTIAAASGIAARDRILSDATAFPGANIDQAISTPTGLTEAQAAILSAISTLTTELHRFTGLDIANPATLTQLGDGVQRIAAGTITQTITSAGDPETTGSTVEFERTA